MLGMRGARGKARVENCNDLQSWLRTMIDLGLRVPKMGAREIA